MGNTLSPLDLRKTKKFDAFIAKYPKLLNQELLSDQKLFKTYSFLSEGESHIIMKVYLKRDNISLREHEASLPLLQREFDLNIYPSLLPYTKLVNESDFAALIRPKISMTLSDRLLGVPILTYPEKLWIIFQLVTALYNLHNLNLFHGAISSSNTLLTTWNHLFLADYAWYAPNYIFEDKFDDINFYYPSSDKKCNLAPEKLISKDYKDIASIQWGQENLSKIKNKTLKSLQKMDIFGLACVIAEIMLDGTSLFTYQQLLAYRRDMYSPQDKIDKIEDVKIRGIVQDMIQKDPDKRMEIGPILTFFAGKIVPRSFFNLIYYVNSSFVSTSVVLPDQRIALIRELLEPIYMEIIGEYPVPHYQPLPIPIQRCQILQSFLKHYTTVRPDFFKLFAIEKPQFFKRTYNIRTGNEYMRNNVKKSIKSIMSATKSPNKEPQSKGKPNAQNDLILIALMICSNIRHVRYLSSMLVALEMLQNFSEHFNDHVNLHIIIPYIFSLLEEQNPKIVVAAFNTACTILAGMRKPLRTKSDRRLFEDYILPNLLKAFQLQELDVARAFIDRLHQLVEIAVVFVTEGMKLEYKAKEKPATINLEDAESIQEIQTEQEEEEELSPLDLKRTTSQIMESDIYREVEKVKLVFVEYIQEIVDSPHPEIHDTLLGNISKLGGVLGVAITEGYLVPHLISALNNNGTKLLSLRELEKLMDVLSEKTVNGLLKLVLEKCVFDMDELVVLQSVRTIVKGLKMKKLVINDMAFLIRTFLPLTVHPNTWIRDHIIELFCEVIKGIDTVNLCVNLRPALSKYLRNSEDITIINPDLFRLLLVDALPRRTYEAARRRDFSQLSNEPQLRELAEILTSRTHGNYSSNSETEVKSAEIKEFPTEPNPKILKNFEDIIRIFCMQASGKHIKELLDPNKKPKQLTDSILAEEDKDHQIDLSAQQVQERQITSLEEIKNIRISLELKITELLTRNHISFLTYVKNVHNFCLSADGILEKARQLSKKKEKKLGSYERYERIVHLGKGWEPNGFLVKTIYEHHDTVNCLDASPTAKTFASASDDGEVKIFDIAKIESDFTCTSIASFSVSGIKDKEERASTKIKELKFLDEDQLVLGTNTGTIEVHSTGDKKMDRINNYEVAGQVVAIQPLSLAGTQREKAFVYVTHNGELGIQDLNEKKASVKFDIGKQKGVITSMLMSPLDQSIMVGTSNGYVLMYDIRVNLLSGVYQLSREAPILSLVNYYPLKKEAPNAHDSLVGVSFGSDFHEVGFWNFNELNEELRNPDIYFYASSNMKTECVPQQMRDSTDIEPIFNIKDAFSTRTTYDALGVQPLVGNIVKYFEDNSSYNLQRNYGKDAPKYSNSAYKILCTPNFSSYQLRHPGTWHRELQNVIFTAGNDLNIRYWNLTSSKSYQVSNMDGKRRSYKNSKNGGTLIFREDTVNEGGQSGGSNNMLVKTGHRDRINDMLVLEKNEIVVTCSRDKTIKVWK